MAVFDASPLIVLASADRLSILETFGSELVVPERVRTEVVDAGIAAGHPDARRVRAAIDRGLLTVREVDRSPLFEELVALDGLSDADAAVLTYAATDDALVVMDERAGRSIAAAEGITSRGSAWIVLSRVERGHISSQEGHSAIDDLVEAGWYCSTDLYRRIVGKLEEL